jgi:hypothetical protein
MKRKKKTRCFVKDKVIKLKHNEDVGLVKYIELKQNEEEALAKLIEQIT